MTDAGEPTDLNAETGLPERRQADAPPALNWVDQDDTLRQMWGENKTPEEIGAELNRSVAAIMTRAARLGLPRRSAPGRKRGYKRTDAPRRAKSAVRVSVSVARAGHDEQESVEVSPPKIKQRVCLMCLNKFQSQGSYNRICPSCKGSAEYMTGSSTPDFTFRVTS